MPAMLGFHHKIVSALWERLQPRILASFIRG